MRALLALKLIVVLGVTPVLPHSFVTQRRNKNHGAHPTHASPRMAPPPRSLRLRSAYQESSIWQLGELPHLYELVQDAHDELMLNLAPRVCARADAATCLTLSVLAGQ